MEDRQVVRGDEHSGPNWRPRFSVLAASVLAVIGLLSIALYVAAPPAGPLSDVRVKNATGLDLNEVVVGPAHYGDIANGDVSPYLSWGPAYRYARVKVRAADQTYRIMPEDYVGETSLGVGKFTYVLALSDPDSEYGLEISVESD
jgi:hypothetical protein